VERARPLPEGLDGGGAARAVSTAANPANGDDERAHHELAPASTSTAALSGRSKGVGVTLHEGSPGPRRRRRYRPVQTGARFSRNAAMPSWASSATAFSHIVALASA
jgi:hypothetical protein